MEAERLGCYAAAMTSLTESPASVGFLLRDWRKRRRQAQLEVALESGISARHLSFIETGRSQPSRDVVLRLAEHLEVPLRERNQLLLAAGFAPAFRERPLSDPALSRAWEEIGRLLAAHEPYPALALDRHWNMVAANRAVAPLMGSISPALHGPPVNVLRASLHPEGVAPRIANLPQWRAHLLARLQHQIGVTGDVVLVELLRELEGYPVGQGSALVHAETEVMVPLRLHFEGTTLSLLSTTMVFGAPLDVTISELALETFFPADHDSAELLQNLIGR
jgi:transcriptional regulator with XRE-family HTH domain